jgi:hypothetical protein
MQEAGMEKTNIVGILAKTAVCTELPVILQKIIATP